MSHFKANTYEIDFWRLSVCLFVRVSVCVLDGVLTLYQLAEVYVYIDKMRWLRLWVVRHELG